VDALIWIGIALGVVAFVALAAVLYWPMPRPEPPKRAVWLDVEVTYAAARAALPAHIREEFHPEWPWLDPHAAPKVKPDPLGDEIRELAGGDQRWTQP